MYLNTHFRGHEARRNKLATERLFLQPYLRAYIIWIWTNMTDFFTPCFPYLYDIHYFHLELLEFDL